MSDSGTSSTAAPTMPLTAPSPSDADPDSAPGVVLEDGPAPVLEPRADPDPSVPGLSGSVLVVCTANVIRSPVVALLLLERLRGTDVTVSSAGVAAADGRPMAAEMQDLLPARLRGPARSTLSRHLSKEMVREADVVITATREQRAAVVTLVPGALRRTFTLGEFAAWTQELAREAPARPVDSVREVVARIPTVRATRRIADDEFDLEDPRGRSRLVHRRIYTLIDTRTRDVADGLLTLAGAPRVTAPR